MSYQVKFHKYAFDEMRFLFDNYRSFYVSLIKIFDSLANCTNKEEILSIIKIQTEDFIEETIIDKQVAFRMGKNVYVYFEICGKMIRIAKIAVINK